MKAVVQYLAYVNGLVTNAESGVMLDRAGPNAIGTVAGSSITTPVAQLDLGDQPRPNGLIIACHPDTSQANFSATQFKFSEQAAANTAGGVPATNRPNQVFGWGWCYNPGGVSDAGECNAAFHMEQYYIAGNLSTPSAPTVNNSGSGGTILAGTYQVKITYLTPVGETTASGATSTTTTGSASTITVTSPAQTGNVSGTRGSASGYNVYVTQAGGSTFTLQNGSPVAVGTNFVLTTPPTSGGVQPPASNTAGQAQMESHQSYTGTDANERRLFTSFFDRISFFIGIQSQHDSVSYIDNGSGNQYLLVKPTGINLGQHTVPCQISAAWNGSPVIVQPNAALNANYALPFVDANNILQVGGQAPGGTISIPKIQIGTNNEIDLGPVGLGVSNQATVRFGQNPSSVQGAFNLDGGNGATATPLILSGANEVNGQSVQLPLILGTAASTAILEATQVSGDRAARFIVTDESSSGNPRAYVDLRNGSGSGAPSLHLNSNSGGADGYVQDSNNNITLGVSAPATTATNGFPYIPAMAGAPTGTPTAKTGYAVVVFDTTNKKIWMYDFTNNAWTGFVSP